MLVVRGTSRGTGAGTTHCAPLSIVIVMHCPAIDERLQHRLGKRSLHTRALQKHALEGLVIAYFSSILCNGSSTG